MADSPDPRGAHEHLFEPHLRASAAADAARTGTGSVICCVICAAPTVIGPPAAAGRGGTGPQDAGEVAPGARSEGGEPERAPAAAGGGHQVVVGHVGAVAATSGRGVVRLRVGPVVVFASRASGHAEALGAAAGCGQVVRVVVERAAGDLYVREVVAL